MRWAKTDSIFVCLLQKERMTCIHTASWRKKQQPSILNMYNAWEKLNIISYFQANVEPWELLNVMILKYKDIFSAYQMDIHIHIYTSKMHLLPVWKQVFLLLWFMTVNKIYVSMTYLAAKNEFKFIQEMWNVRKMDDSHMSVLEWFPLNV